MIKVMTVMMNINDNNNDNDIFNYSDRENVIDDDNNDNSNCPYLSLLLYILPFLHAQTQRCNTHKLPQ